jgi:DNA-binding transcriptional LysR family regulator
LLSINPAFAMELRDLAYFETIAELEHMGAAAGRLHRTQPALTASVRRLEEFCGAPLLERAGRGIRLTAAGKVLLDWARRVRLDVQDARRQMADLGQGVAGHVRLGVVPTAAQYLLPAALQRLMRDAPQVTVQATVGLRAGLGASLQAGELDVVVVSGQRPDAAFASSKLGEDRIVVVASHSHPLVRGKKAVTMADLSACDWILQPAGSPTRDWIEHAFERRGLSRPRVRIESDMLLMLPALVEGTELLGFVSRLHLQRAGRASGLREIPVAGLAMRRHFVATWRKSAYLPAAAGLLIRLLAEAGSAVQAGE